MNIISGEIPKKKTIMAQTQFPVDRILTKHLI